MLCSICKIKTITNTLKIPICTPCQQAETWVTKTKEKTENLITKHGWELSPKWYKTGLHSELIYIYWQCMNCLLNLETNSYQTQTCECADLTVCVEWKRNLKIQSDVAISDDIDWEILIRKLQIAQKKESRNES